MTESTAKKHGFYLHEDYLNTISGDVFGYSAAGRAHEHGDRAMMNLDPERQLVEEAGIELVRVRFAVHPNYPGTTVNFYVRLYGATYIDTFYINKDVSTGKVMAMCEDEDPSAWTSLEDQLVVMKRRLSNPPVIPATT